MTLAAMLLLAGDVAGESVLCVGGNGHFAVEIKDHEGDCSVSGGVRKGNVEGVANTPFSIASASDPSDLPSCSRTACRDIPLPRLDSPISAAPAKRASGPNNTDESVHFLLDNPRTWHCLLPSSHADARRAIPPTPFIFARGIDILQR